MKQVVSAWWCESESERSFSESIQRDKKYNRCTNTTIAHHQEITSVSMFRIYLHIFERLIHNLFGVFQILQNVIDIGLGHTSEAIKEVHGDGIPAVRHVLSLLLDKGGGRWHDRRR
jgi:hypothetical protein